MQLTPTILLAMMAAFGAADDSFSCQQRHPQYWNAINKFCAKTDIVVPTNYSERGKGVNAHRAFITGNCNPKQWVPSDVCRGQFYSMCIGADNDITFRNYGTNNCQRWTLWYKG